MKLIGALVLIFLVGAAASETAAACEFTWQRATGVITDPETGSPTGAVLVATEICVGETDLRLYWGGAWNPLEIRAQVSSPTATGCVFNACAYGPPPGAAIRIQDPSLGIDLVGFALAGPYSPVQAWPLAGTVFGEPAAFGGQSIANV